MRAGQWFIHRPCPLSPVFIAVQVRNDRCATYCTMERFGDSALLLLNHRLHGQHTQIQDFERCIRIIGLNSD